MLNFDSVVSYLNGFDNVGCGISSDPCHSPNYFYDIFWTLDPAVACDDSFPTTCLCCWLDFDYFWFAPTVHTAVDHDFGWTLDFVPGWIHKWTISSLKNSCNDDKVHVW